MYDIIKGNVDDNSFVFEAYPHRTAIHPKIFQEEIRFLVHSQNVH